MADAPKVIDPGNEFSGPKKGSLEWVISWVRKYPATTLPSGEGKMLLDEIDRLRALAVPAVDKMEERMKEMLSEQDALRGKDPLTKALP